MSHTQHQQRRLPRRGSLLLIVGGILLVAMPVVAAAALRGGTATPSETTAASGATSAGTSTTNPTTSPITGPRKFVLARQFGPLAAGIAVSDLKTDAPEVTATLLGDAGPVSGDRIRLALQATDGTSSAAATPCGAGCYRARLHIQGQPRSIRLTDARPAQPPTQVDFPLPTVWPPPPADALLRRVSATIEHLRSDVSEETLTAGLGHTDVTRFQEVAPHQLSYVIRNGPQGIVIGTKRWDRTSPTGPWTESEQSAPVNVPAPGWDTKPQNASLLGTGRIDGHPAIWLSFVDTPFGTPIWFTIGVDRNTLRMLDMRMVTTAHFMHDHYTSFNQPLRITPPR